MILGGKTMKLKDDYILSDVWEGSVLVPVGDAADDFRGIIHLNETAAFIVKQLQKDTTPQKIVEELLSEYEIERSEAALHVKAVLDKLNEAGVIQE